MRVTFDTNTLDKVCRPDLSSRNPNQHLFYKVHEAVKDKRIQGAFSETLLTIEGIKNIDRIDVFGNTTFARVEEDVTQLRKENLEENVQAWLGDVEEIEAVKITFQARQQSRQPLALAMADRVRAAVALGLSILHAPPRIASSKLEGDIATFYLPHTTNGTLEAWIDKALEVTSAIEARGVGRAVLADLAAKLTVGDEPWYRALLRATDVHTQRAIQRAFGEWADGDSIASHVAYGMDVFCTDDMGRSAGAPSVLDTTTRAWLTLAYNVRFMNVEELADELS